MPFKKVKIATERLFLREYVPADWEAVHEYAQFGDILVYESWGPNTEQDTRDFIKTCIEDQIAGNRKNFDLAIILKKEKKLIGGCRFEFTNNEKTSGYLGYIVNRRYWDNGYATEATMALINYFSGISKLKTIEATCDLLNIASQKVLEKCGFTRLRVIEKDIKMKGRFRDTCVYEKIIVKF